MRRLGKMRKKRSKKKRTKEYLVVSDLNMNDSVFIFMKF